MKASNFFDFSVDTKHCIQVEAEVTNPEVKICASRFAHNMSSVRSLLLLPKNLFAIGGYGTERIYAQTMAKILSMLQSRLEGKGADDEFMDKWQGYLADAIAEGGDQRFEPMAREFVSITLEGIDSARDSFRVLMFSAISSSWTSFEFLAKDIWISALNNHPIPLGQQAIGELSSDISKEGISRKHIEVGLAARYGFDLRGRLGTILSEKYDFTGVNGIAKAYKDAFGPEQALIELFAELGLKHLEATRHAIVHNAGRVDERYRFVTGSSIADGAYIDFNVVDMSELINAATGVGCDLIEYVDAWFRMNRSEESRNSTA